MLYVIGLCVLILKVAIGLGFVIFVHELGHFAVAKLCGVKCEKFYLGFDIAGLRFCKFRWGETECGIVGAAAQLAMNGLRPKNLRLVKSAIDREIGLVEQVLLPALKSRRPERRREGLDQLEDIVQATTQLRQLLLTRGIRRLTAGTSGEG